MDPTISKQPTDRPGLDLVVISVGNSRARVGSFVGGDLTDPVSLEVGDTEAIVQRSLSVMAQSEARAIVLSTVNAPASDAIAAGLREGGTSVVYTIGKDLQVPIQHSLKDDRTVGHDRLLCALAAFARAQQACVVIDAGTAITIDFVDGEGTFHGGAIGPGVRMMARALHEQTSALPAVESMEDLEEAFGKDTPEAMTLGVLSFARGGVHRLIERYAEAFGAYPQIVATGGDAALLFRSDEVIEHVVPDLQLIGIHEACLRELSESED